MPMAQHLHLCRRRPTRSEATQQKRHQNPHRLQGAVAPTESVRWDEKEKIMLFTRWERPAWNALQQLHSEVNRLFDHFDGSRRDAPAFPPVNVFEDEAGFHVEADLPGLDLADLEITVTGPNQLKLKGERKSVVPEKAVAHRQERSFGAFVRTVTLPTPVDADKVEARFEHGVLHVTLPKHEQAKPRKIVVKS